MIHKPTAIPFFEKSLNWLIAKETSNSTTLKKKQKNKQQTQQKSPHKKILCFYSVIYFQKSYQDYGVKGTL